MQFFSSVGQKFVAAQGAPLSSGAGWRTTWYGTGGLPDYYWAIAGILEIPTVVTGDPISGTPWYITNGAGLIQGETAHDAVDANYPIKIGGKASTSAPTAVSVSDRVNAWFDTNGRLAIHDGAGSITVDGSVSAVAAGDVASGSSDSGNPVKIGYKAQSTIPSDVTDGYRVNGWSDLKGRGIVTGAPRGTKAEGNITLTSTSETTLITAVASTYLDLTKLIIGNSSATATSVKIRDDTAGTVRMTIPIAAYGGAIIDFGLYPKEQTATNKNWTAQLSGAVTSVEVYGQAIKNT